MNKLKIIMNPPYDGNLHLKILSNIIEKFLDDTTEIINLSPATELKNVTESISEIFYILPFINDVLFIDEKTISRIFNITLRKECAIWHLSKSQNKKFKYNFQSLSIYKKIKNKSKSWRSKCIHKSTNDPFLYMQGDNGYAKGWHLNFDNVFNMTNPTEKSARLFFKTIDEKKNFIESCKLKVYKYIYYLDNKSVVPAHMPFLEDYTKPWTNKMLYEYFDLNEDEIKTIEEEISKYE